jgi:hypothetical protein
VAIAGVTGASKKNPSKKDKRAPLLVRRGAPRLVRRDHSRESAPVVATLSRVIVQLLCGRARAPLVGVASDLHSCCGNRNLCCRRRSCRGSGSPAAAKTQSFVPWSSHTILRKGSVGIPHSVDSRLVLWREAMRRRLRPLPFRDGRGIILTVVTRGV